MLLLAGLGGDGASWGPVADALSAYFRVITYDNRGAGAEWLSGTEFSIADMADDARVVLDALALPRAHVLGHSMGGYIALELAARHPDRVDRLTLLSTAAVSSARNNALFGEMVRLRQDGCDLETWVRRWAFWLFTRAWFEDPTHLPKFVRFTRAYPNLQTAQGFAAQVRAVAAYDIRDRLPRIRAETLVLAGAEDILITQDESFRLATHLPCATFRMLPDAAHLAHVEAPEAFLQAVHGA